MGAANPVTDKPAIVRNQLAAGGGELRPADAANVNRGIERAELAGQRAGVEVAGRLAARQHEARGQGAGRVNRAGSSGGLIAMTLTRRSSIGCPPRRTVAV